MNTTEKTDRDLLRAADMVDQLLNAFARYEMAGPKTHDQDRKDLLDRQAEITAMVATSLKFQALIVK